MNQDKKCANCGGDMEFLGEEQIQLGQAGFFLGHLSNLLSGSLEVELWECPDCGKLDFYRRGSAANPDDEEYEEGHMVQVICPRCGQRHDLDDPKCPYCGLNDPNYS